MGQHIFITYLINMVCHTSYRKQRPATHLPPTTRQLGLGLVRAIRPYFLDITCISIKCNTTYGKFTKNALDDSVSVVSYIIYRLILKKCYYDVHLLTTPYYALGYLY